MFDCTDPTLRFVNNQVFIDLRLNRAFPCSHSAARYIQNFYRIVDTGMEALLQIADAVPDPAVREALPKLAGQRFYRRNEFILYLQRLLKKTPKKVVREVIMERLRYVDGFLDVEFLFGHCLWPISVYMGYGIILYRRRGELYLSSYDELDSCCLYIVNRVWNEKPTTWETLYEDLRRPGWESEPDEEDEPYVPIDADDPGPIDRKEEMKIYHKEITSLLAPLVKQHLAPELFARIWGSVTKVEDQN